MKTLYWKTRPFRRTATGGRRAHWPNVALNLALAFAFVALAVGGLALALLTGVDHTVAEWLEISVEQATSTPDRTGLKAHLAELFGLAEALLPIIVTWALALAAGGLGDRMMVPTDRLPGEAGEPPAQRTTRWFHWANLRALLFGGLAAATVLAMAWTYSGWQGRRAWEAYRADAVKRGVEFDLEKLMPPPVPDAENFAATPLLRAFQGGNPEFLSHRATNRNSEPIFPVNLAAPDVKEPLPRVEWLRGERLNLADLQTYFRSSTNFPAWPAPRTPAEDVLKALSRFDAELAETHAAATRPHTRFNTQLTEDGVSTLIPHLAAVKSLETVVAMRSVALLATGRTNDAFADAKLAFRLAETVRGDALYISYLVRIALHNIALRTVWEGLAEHRWSDAYLAHWQVELARLDFAAELRHAMRGERAFGNRALDYVRRRPEMLDALGGDGGKEDSEWAAAFSKLISRLPPPGWMCTEQINLNRAYEDFIVGALPAENEPLHAAAIRAKKVPSEVGFVTSGQGLKGMLRHRVMSVMLLPAFGGAALKACQTQAITHIAAAACALERHWLARGSYPESLAALTPEFGPLPPDPMSGQPFRYERTADGRFRLWSIGWNGKDDGGTVAVQTPGLKNSAIDFEQGDWVWPVPVQQP